MKSVFIICVAIFVWGALHSILATDKSKLLLGNISKTMSRFYRIFYNIFSIVSLFPIVYLVIWLADKPIYTITYPWILVSFLIQVAAAGLMIIGIRQSGLLIFLGIEFKSNMDLNSKEQMITDGLYRIVRHPLYSLGLLNIMAKSSYDDEQIDINNRVNHIYCNWCSFRGKTTRKKNFGNDYGIYKLHTPMFIPSLALRRKTKIQ